MTAGVGIGLAFIAMLCWGFGDFLIQRSTRKVGDWEALFFISLFGVVVLLPFVYKRLPALISSGGETLLVLGVLCFVLFFAAILDFEALRVGKLAVIEPVWSFEVPVSALLAFFILSERISWSQGALIVALLVGLALVSLRSKFELRRLLLERGTMLALFGAVMMGAANFFMGWGSRLSDPLMANFLADLFIAAVTLVVLVSTGRFRRTLRDSISNRGLLIPMSVADKVAWVAFAFALVLAPIAIATALSESYIIIAVILGLIINRERLLSHQKVGLSLATLSAIALAALTV